MKPKLNYVPWKITLLEEYRGQSSNGPTPEQRIHDGIKSWRRFPVCYGAGAQADTVFCLIDRLSGPFALLNPALHQIARAEKCKPSELPESLRELYDRLRALGHAA